MLRIQVSQVAAKKSASLRTPPKPGQFFVLSLEPVLLFELGGSKGKVLNRQGHLKSIRLSDLTGPFGQPAPLSLGKDVLKTQLNELYDSALGIEESLVLHEVWELLSNEEQRDFHPSDLAELWFGESTPASELAFYRATKSDAVYFSVKNLSIEINDAKKKERLLSQQVALEEKKKKSEAVISWFVANHGRKVESFPETVSSVIQSLRDSALHESPVLESSLSGKVLSALNLPLANGAFTLLADLGVFSPDENLLVHTHAVQTEFTSEVLEASEQIAQKYASGTGLFYDRFREEVSSPVYTIDDEDTTDRDDGLSVELHSDGSFTVGIHITDVSAFIKKDSVLDRDAFKRATSVYLPDVKYPMFPESLSSDCLSLLPGTKKRCVSVFVDVDPKTGIGDSRCALTFVNVDRGLTYNEALDILQSATDTEALSPSPGHNSAPDCSQALRCLRTAADFAKAQRFEKGARESEQDFEMKVVVKDGNISTWKLPKKCPARTLVAEMAILANSLIAQYMRDHAIPAIYRCQSEDASYDGDSLNQDDEVDALPLLNKVVVSVDPAPHRGIGLDLYTQATSPVRRYCDLVVQRQLAAALSGVEETNAYSESELEFVIDGTLMMTDAVKRIERWGVRYWLLKYLKSRKGEPMSSVVADKRKEFLLVELSDYLIKGKLYPLAGSNYGVGDSLTVEVSGTNPRKGFIRLKESC